MILQGIKSFMWFNVRRNPKCSQLQHPTKPSVEYGSVMFHPLAAASHLLMASYSITNEFFPRNIGFRFFLLGFRVAFSTTVSESMTSMYPFRGFPQPIPQTATFSLQSTNTSDKKERCKKKHRNFSFPIEKNTCVIFFFATLDLPNKPSVSVKSRVRSRKNRWGAGRNLNGI